MWRLLIGAVVLSYAALPAASQSLPSKKEAAVLLQKAAEATNLRASDTPAFHLVAHVHHDSAGYRADGAYELLWASPDRYREDFRVQAGQDMIAESDVALADRFYTARNTAVESFSLWRVRRAVRSVHWFFFEGAKAKVRRVYPATVADKMSICVDAALVFKDSRTCFDPSTLKAISLSLKTSDVQAEFSDFSDLGDKRYPRHIVLKEFGDAVEVKVDVLDRVAEFDPNVFVPSRECITRDWCSKPIAKGTWPDPWTSQRLTTMYSPSLVAYYLLVGQDGRVKKSAPMQAAMKDADLRVESWLATVRYPVELCNGQPIEYEIVIQPLPHHPVASGTVQIIGASPPRPF